MALITGLRIWHCRELWYRPATIAPIRPLAWEPPYAAGAALKKKKQNKRTRDCGITVREQCLFFLMAACAAYGSSRARDRTRATAVTLTTAATQAPLIHCSLLRTQPKLPQQPKPLQSVLNPLCHRGTSQNCHYLQCLFFSP